MERLLRAIECNTKCDNGGEVDLQPVIDKLDEVNESIQNMEINIDAESIELNTEAMEELLTEIKENTTSTGVVVPRGATVQITGEEMSLEEIIDSRFNGTNKGKIKSLSILSLTQGIVTMEGNQIQLNANTSISWNQGANNFISPVVLNNIIFHTGGEFTIIFEEEL